MEVKIFYFIEQQKIEKHKDWVENIINIFATKEFIRIKYNIILTE